MNRGPVAGKPQKETGTMITTPSVRDPSRPPVRPTLRLGFSPRAFFVTPEDTMIQGKRCSGCGKWCALTEYHKKTAHKDGLDSRCKTCEAAKARAYYEAHKEEIIARSHAYYQAHREEVAASTRAYRATHKDKIVASDAAYNARPEVKAKKAAYREENREEEAERKHAWLLTPKGRTSSRAASLRRRLYPGGQDITSAMTAEVMDASGGICPYCSEPFEDGHIDHIIPVSRGGTNDRVNLVYCCASCNLSKGDRLLEDWLSTSAVCIQ